MDISTLEEDINLLSPNVEHQSPSDAAPHASKGYRLQGCGNLRTRKKFQTLHDDRELRWAISKIT